LIINFNSKIIAAIIILWTIIHILLLFHFGIKTNGESIKYISEANNLIKGQGLSSPSFWMYITQIFLILTSIKLKLGYEFVVVIQLLFSLLATLSIYKLATFLFSSKIGFFATIWFLFNLPLHQFNTFLQTDSLFYSFTIIYSCYLLQVKGLSLKVVAIVLLALILLSLTRPTGLFFFPATFLYLYLRFFNSIRLSYKLVSIVIISAIFFYFLNAAVGSGGELDFMLPARDERIICGVPTLHYFVKINETENGNSLYGLFYYITHNFSQFSRLAFERSIAFFGIIRSYYSIAHKIYLILLFFPIYFMFILSIKYWIKKKPFILLYFVCLIFLTWVTVILSCDDWHNRFYLTISPYMVILALPSINRFFFKNFSS
jgi:hypothetical protein